MKGRRHGSDGVGHRRRVPGAKEEGGEKTTIPRAGRCLGGGGGNGSTVAARQEEREEEEEGTEEEVPLEAVNATVVSALFWPTLHWSGSTTCSRCSSQNPFMRKHCHNFKPC
eukprot:TRINITY_DN1044_c1_g1_i5.p2 TRINITY_DN1044_c1_g1~~TRINITY_DN1044_c1_g1_i5.p2  ORF type:complete len:112 (-),score=26.75 TRINITY_DN1044_c1_g1_i5:534-869(-)